MHAPVAADPPFARSDSGVELCAPKSGRLFAHRVRADEKGKVSPFELMLVTIVVVILFALALPPLLRVPPQTSNIDANANLMNAVVAARNLYFSYQSYDYENTPYSPLSFAIQAPEFSWNTGSCAGKSTNCMSEAVVDMNSSGDAQGVVLAAWSSVTKTCWYALDAEMLPRAISDDSSGTAFDTGSNGNGTMADPGIYFGRSPSGVSSCSATDALDGSAHSDWSNAFSSAGLVGVAAGVAAAEAGSR
jgi:hypothetical protein